MYIWTSNQATESNWEPDPRSETNYINLPKPSVGADPWAKACLSMNKPQLGEATYDEPFFHFSVSIYFSIEFEVHLDGGL